MQTYTENQKGKDTHTCQRCREISYTVPRQVIPCTTELRWQLPVLSVATHQLPDRKCRQPLSVVQTQCPPIFRIPDNSSIFITDSYVNFYGAWRCGPKARSTPATTSKQHCCLYRYYHMTHDQGRMQKFAFGEPSPSPFCPFRAEVSTGHSLPSR